MKRIKLFKILVMKKTNRSSKIAWLSVYFLLVFVSCQKDENDDHANAKTKTELLTTGTWKYTGATVKPAYDYYGDGAPTENIFAIMKDCEKDDFESYKTDGVWEYNEGPSKCDPSYPQIFSLPWNFADNETKLILGTDEHVILELTATELKLRYTFEDGGVIYTEEDTYEH